MWNWIEAVEPRRLMAATAELGSDGTLVVTGTSGAEKIELTQSSRADRGQPISVNVTPAGGKKTTLGSFKVADVKRIEVRAGAKKDSVLIQLKQDIPTLVDGGQGNDDLRTNRGRTTLQGGAGDDLLVSQVTSTLRFSRERLTSAANIEFRGGNASTGFILTRPADGSTVFRYVAPTVTEVRGVDKAGRPKVVRDARAAIADEPISVHFNAKPDSNGFTGVIAAAPYTLSLGENRALIDATYNTLDGGDGDDTIASLGGEDSVIGGAGDDQFAPLGAEIETRLNDLSPVKTKDKETASRVSLAGIELIKAEPIRGVISVVPVTKVTVRVSSLIDDV